MKVIRHLTCADMIVAIVIGLVIAFVGIRIAISIVG